MNSSSENAPHLSDEMLRHLAGLARRGACIAARHPNASEAVSAEIICRRHGIVEQVGKMPFVLLSVALADRLLEPNGECLILSARGRAAIRRARAEKVVAAAAAPDRPRFDPSESPLTRLFHRLDKDGAPLITRQQFEAGEQLRKDLWIAGLTPKVTQSWDGIPQGRRQRQPAPGTGREVAPGVAAAQMRVTLAFAEVGKAAEEYIDLLFDVCGHLRGLEEIERTACLPQRSARRFLQLALTALARHYGMLPLLDVDAAVKARLRHWGVQNYRLSSRAPRKAC